MCGYPVEARTFLGMELWISPLNALTPESLWPFGAGDPGVGRPEPADLRRLKAKSDLRHYA